MKIPEIADYPEAARVWIYQASREVDPPAAHRIHQEIETFTEVWTSHNVMLRATGGFLHNRFVVLIVDETRAGASGCSIDKSVAFIRKLEQDHSITLLDRLTFAYLEENEVRTVGKDLLSSKISSGAITDETPFFDNLVKTLGEFNERWITPLGESWIKRMA